MRRRRRRRRRRRCLGDDAQAATAARPRAHVHQVLVDGAQEPQVLELEQLRVPDVAVVAERGRAPDDVRARGVRPPDEPRHDLEPLPLLDPDPLELAQRAGVPCPAAAPPPRGEHGLLGLAGGAARGPRRVIEDRVDGVAPRLVRRLHRRHPGERAHVRPGDDEVAVVHEVSALPGRPQRAGERTGARLAVAGRQVVGGPRPAARTQRPLSGDVDQERRVVSPRADPGVAPGRILARERDVVVEVIEARAWRPLLGVLELGHLRAGHDLPLDLGRDRVAVELVRIEGALAAAAPRPDVDAQVAGQLPAVTAAERPPELDLRDRRQAPRRGREVDVAVRERDVALVVELDPGERLEPIADPAVRARVADRRDVLEIAVLAVAVADEPVEVRDRADRVARSAQRPGHARQAGHVERRHDVVRADAPPLHHVLAVEVLGRRRAAGERDLEPGAMPRGIRRGAARVDADRRDLAEEEPDALLLEERPPVLEPARARRAGERRVALIEELELVHQELDVDVALRARVRVLRAHRDERLRRMLQRLREPRRVIERRLRGRIAQVGLREERPPAHVLVVVVAPPGRARHVAQDAEREPHQVDRPVVEVAPDRAVLLDHPADRGERLARQRRPVGPLRVGDELPPDLLEVVVRRARRERPRERIEDRRAPHRVAEVAIERREEAEAVLAGDQAEVLVHADVEPDERRRPRRLVVVDVDARRRQDLQPVERGAQPLPGVAALVRCHRREDVEQLVEAPVGAVDVVRALAAVDDDDDLDRRERVGLAALAEPREQPRREVVDPAAGPREPERVVVAHRLRAAPIGPEPHRVAVDRAQRGELPGLARRRRGPARASPRPRRRRGHRRAPHGIEEARRGAAGERLGAPLGARDPADVRRRQAASKPLDHRIAPGGIAIADAGGRSVRALDHLDPEAAGHELVGDGEAGDARAEHGHPDLVLVIEPRRPRRRRRRRRGPGLGRGPDLARLHRVDAEAEDVEVRCRSERLLHLRQAGARARLGDVDVEALVERPPRRAVDPGLRGRPQEARRLVEGRHALAEQPVLLLTGLVGRDDQLAIGVVVDAVRTRHDRSPGSRPRRAGAARRAGARSTARARGRARRW